MTDHIVEEMPLDPARPIIDPHLHLWEILPMPGTPQLLQRFLFHEVQDAIENSGHNITHSVFVECHAMYRCDGPEDLKPVGETEFANGNAAMSASGSYGSRRICHRIVGSANLLLGAAVEMVLDAQLAAAGERFRGIRFGTAWSEAGLFGYPCDPAMRSVMMNPLFRAGAQRLAEKDLSLDVWCLHTQLDELIDLADALPDLTIVLDHLGTPEYMGYYAHKREQAYAEWAVKIAALAQRPNVLIKLGGMGMDISTQIGVGDTLATSETLAAKWRPYIETCIDVFSPQRAMFESNFPPDNAAGSYGAIWNAFKIIVDDYSNNEKDRLFSKTAAETYRIDVA